MGAEEKRPHLDFFHQAVLMSNQNIRAAEEPQRRVKYRHHPTKCFPGLNSRPALSGAPLLKAVPVESSRLREAFQNKIIVKSYELRRLVEGASLPSPSKQLRLAADDPECRRSGDRKLMKVLSTFMCKKKKISQRSNYGAKSFYAKESTVNTANQLGGENFSTPPSG